MVFISIFSKKELLQIAIYLLGNHLYVHSDRELTDYRNILIFVILVITKTSYVIVEIYLYS